MLVTAGTKDKFNTMTASWGGLGWLWNKPVAFIFIRPERYTYELVKNSLNISLSFLGKEQKAKEIYTFCGTKSGRELDKIKVCGLNPIFTQSGGITYEEARLTLECKRLYETSMKAEDFMDTSILNTWYNEQKGNLHQILIAEINNVWINE